MYEYLTDKEFLSKLRSTCGRMMQELCHQLKEDYDISSTPFLIGSGNKKLITQNGKEGCDLDYNIEIVCCNYFDDCRYIKESVRKAFNKVLHNNNWGDCQDSTSSLTSEKRYFTSGNPTSFSIDVGIVCRDKQNNWHRLIHEKYGCAICDRYYWNIAPKSHNVSQKADKIKKAGKWQFVRDEYLDLKNIYLRRNDKNHPSFICYIEAVNNVFNKIFY